VKDLNLGVSWARKSNSGGAVQAAPPRSWPASCRQEAAARQVAATFRWPRTPEKQLS